MYPLPPMTSGRIAGPLKNEIKKELGVGVHTMDIVQAQYVQPWQS